MRLVLSGPGVNGPGSSGATPMPVIVCSPCGAGPALCREEMRRRLLRDEAAIDEHGAAAVGHERRHHPIAGAIDERPLASSERLVKTRHGFVVARSGPVTAVTGW